MTSMPVRIFAQMRNAVSQCRSPCRMTSGGRKFCDGSQHHAGFEPTEAKTKRNGDSDAIAGIVRGAAPYISYIYFISYSSPPLFSFILHYIFLRQRHH